MNAIYVMTSSDRFLIKKKLDEIKMQHKIDSMMEKEYDLEEDSLDLVLEDLDTYSFLTPKKFIVVYNASFLSSEKTKEESSIIHLEKYLDNPNLDHIVVFITSKLDERKKIVKKIKKVASIIDFDLDVNKFTKDLLKDYSLENGLVSFLIDRLKGNVSKIYQECEKLKIYKIDDRKITKDDVLSLVEKSLDDSDAYYFAFIQAIVAKDKKSSLEMYNELLSLGVEPLKILTTLASQIRLIYQVKVLSKRRYSNEEIAKELECHPYRVIKTKELIYDYTFDDLVKNLVKLNEMDLKIKKGEILPSLAIELFILGI